MGVDPALPDEDHIVVENNVFPKNAISTACIVSSKHDYDCQVKVGNHPRFKDTPPDGTKPDPDYVPKHREWCWLWRNQEWSLRQRRSGMLKREDEGWVSLDRYKGHCLPAAAPTK